ncbi:hypothetical protein CONCODRAFT_84757 [Conidiobolus coronatus NRRL 28638]|uniref:Beta-trefoil n=1 Tax=Conidiobolus coronatus (strain ATCC 28846 / CBS 209.66 / NRRL 28638) TaxID=796925 RepID=A0A137P8L1_CONC2|nr:hypothetical protein CONCODRAFT_84757 [Conidiobolus coronatus NRRL 28638]|eukprot:KXN71347.1 hypothetical protein CONCODRAFT_84757 [Conidiobolus coronatus NRRL 28638]
MSIKNLISSRSPSPRYNYHTSDPYNSDSLRNDQDFEYHNPQYLATPYRSSPFRFPPNFASVPDPVQDPSGWQRHCISSIKNLLFSDSSRSEYLGLQTALNMTQVSCYLVTVAQKSYGSEKRYLNPPPIITVTPPANPLLTIPKLHSVNLTILNESGQDIISQNSLLHNNLAIFKTLHIANTSGNSNDGTKSDKSKSFRLKVQLHNHSSSSNSLQRPHSENYMDYLPSMPSPSPNSNDKPESFATFLTDSIPIISKPSKKSFNQTLKSPSCIYSGSTISLFNRINHQTFRTQYLNIQNNKLCAKVNFWSPFIIKLYNGNGNNINRYNHASIISYKSCVTLTDPRSGMTFGPFILLKVEKNQILHDAQGPVTQLQKVALRSYNPDQPKFNDIPTYLATKKPSMTDSYSDVSSSQTTTTLPIVLSAINTNDNGFVNSCTVEDHHYWTLVNITRLDFNYSLEANPNAKTISPFPILQAKPKLQNEAKELVIDYQTSEDLQNLQVWIGCCGPILPTQPASTSRSVTYSLPVSSYILGENFSNYSNTQEALSLPIFLINRAGVIYHTKYYFSLRVNDLREIVDTQII